MNIIQELEQEQMNRISAVRAIPEFAPGDTVRVMVKVVEGKNTRNQAYEGVVIGRAGTGLNENFTVRKISYGEGVERVFPLYSPRLDSIDVVRRGKVLGVNSPADVADVFLNLEDVLHDVLSK